MIRPSVRNSIRFRADDRCEYCRIRQDQVIVSHQIDHIIARQHGGSDDPDNLAFACLRCNNLKGTNISGLDPLTRILTPLYHPRQDVWLHHFEFQRPRIIGLTPVGRTTVSLLAINDPKRVRARTDLLLEGDLS